MSYLSVEELELLSFFSVEPQPLDPKRPWPYNDFLYKVEIAPYAISFTIAPADRDLSFSVTHNGLQIYAFQATALKDVRYHKDADVETLEIVVSDHDTIWFRLLPGLLITQHAGEA
jgi:hypothetical protein